MAELVKLLINPKSDSIDIASKFTVGNLETIIQYSSDKYYNKTPVISDELYDILIDFLKLRSPKSEVLKNIGAPLKSKNKVKLDYWLGSMDKIKPPSNQLAIWTKKYKCPYNLSDKLDGISALLIYRFNGSINMFTRGTASEGMDISPLIKYLNLPTFKSVSKYCEKNNIKGEHNLIAFRGELIISNDVFTKKWSDTLKNGRNSVAGLVNSKTINPALAKDTNLIIYEIVDPFYSINQQLTLVEKMGFITVVNKTINKELTFEYLSKYLKKRRATSTYQIDGIIVTSGAKQTRNIDGNPDYAFAFKDILEDQMAKTTVESVEWNISKDGYINPILILKPISIGGVEIKRATGFNAKYIVDNILGSGAKVELIRSGDVIPYITKVLKPSKSGKPDLPDIPWHWNETKVDIQIDNLESNHDMLIKNLYYFFSSLNTKGLGEKNIEKLVASGLDTVPKILTSDEQQLREVEGFGEKTATNLMESIKKAMINIPLAKLMAASNKLGHGLGEERMKQVLAKYPKILTEYKHWTKIDFVNKIKEIAGWENKTAHLLVSNFDEFVKFYDSIKKYITLDIVKDTSKHVTGIFTNKIVVLTGFRDKILQEQIEVQGGKIGTSISKNTNYLVVKDKASIDDPSDKIVKATNLGITIITKDNLIIMLNNNTK